MNPNDFFTVDGGPGPSGQRLIDEFLAWKEKLKAHPDREQAIRWMLAFQAEVQKAKDRIDQQIADRIN